MWRHKLQCLYFGNIKEKIDYLESVETKDPDIKNMKKKIRFFQITILEDPLKNAFNIM